MKQPHCFLILCLSLATFIPAKGQDITIFGQLVIDNFDQSITTINGDLTLLSTNANYPITDLSNLSNITNITGNLKIKNCGNLSNLDGLSNLTSIGGDLEISYNNSLTSIDGLSNITSLEGLNLSTNYSLPNIDGLSNLTSIAGDCYLASNYNLLNVDALSNVTSIGGDFVLIIGANLNIDGLSNVTSIGGGLFLDGHYNLSDIDVLSNVTFIGGDLEIGEDLPSTALSLSSLTTVGGTVLISWSGLNNLDGLSSLTTIGGTLDIQANFGLNNIDGLSNLTSIGGGLFIEYNEGLHSIEGLSNLTTIGDFLFIHYQHYYLKDLDALSNLVSVGGNFTIYNNISLKDCCGIQDLLNTPGAINGNVSIFDNNSGCDNGNQVLNADCTIDIDEILSNSNLPPCTPPASNQIYVNHIATGANDGSSWTNAFTDLQTAIASATGNCSNIFVAGGIYKPTNTTNRGVSFTIDKNLNIYGGFPSVEDEMDTEFSPTVLSGDIDIDDDGAPSGNSFHVVKAINGAKVSLYNLTIRDGNADSFDSFDKARGGGIYVNGANLNLRNCKIINNKAIYGGGIFSTLSSQTYVLDCLLDSNEAALGSAIYHTNKTNLYLVKSRVLNNNSTTRCAIEVNNSFYTYIENSVIANNSSQAANALGLIATNRDQICEIRNSTILGGTQDKNLIRLQIGLGDELICNINNSIVAHQNLSFNKNVKAFNNGILNFNHNNCYFQGASAIGTGTNTLFSDTDGDLLLNADYSVGACSPVVDSGENAYATGLLTSTDIDEKQRNYNSIIDIGAYENQETCLAVPRSGGKNQNEYQADYTLYPNPTSGMVYISSESNEILISIHDVLGQEIIPMEQRNTFDLSNLSKGTYFVQVYNEQGQFLSAEKLIKY